MAAPFCKKENNMKRRIDEKTILLTAFLFVPVLLMVAFVVYPALEMIRYSLTNWDGSSKTYEYIGLGNYLSVILKNKDIWLSLKNNLIYLILSIVFIPIEILFAVRLNGEGKSNNVFKTIFFLPYIINGVAVSYIFSYFYSSYNGGLNGILSLLGMEGLIQRWLSDPKVVNWSLAFVYVWKNIGFFIVLFLSGLQTIPEEIMDASQVDGANRAQRLVYIILPQIKSVVKIVFFMNITWCLQVFDIPFVMTSGGPGNASSTFSTYAIKTAFTFNQFGLANAMAIILMLIIVVLLTLQNRLFKEED